jgi:hypothetical protein
VTGAAPMGTPLTVTLAPGGVVTIVTGDANGPAGGNVGADAVHAPTSTALIATTDAMNRERALIAAR